FPLSCCSQLGWLERKICARTNQNRRKTGKAEQLLATGSPLHLLHAFYHWVRQLTEFLCAVIIPSQSGTWLGNRRGFPVQGMSQHTSSKHNIARRGCLGLVVIEGTDKWWINA